ncbi:MAG: nitroreductase family protein [Acidimicrobiales bacterium]|nr:nitroreductase family protein [Acidimicrobiales bacterium]
MELTEVFRSRRMTRNFSGRPLGRDIVDQLVGAALRAPSAGNTQGREFVVLEGASETSLYWQTATDEGWRSQSRRFEGMARAPVIVLPFADPEAYIARYREPDKSSKGGDVEWVVPYWFVDAAFATMAMLLAATDQGIGAAFLGNFRGEETLRAVLGVPDRLRLVGAVLLGEPSRPDPQSTSGARPRRTPEDSVHRGGW